MYVLSLKDGIQANRVISEEGINKGDDLLVKYGGSYFGADRSSCECPHKEFHGGGVHVIET